MSTVFGFDLYHGTSFQKKLVFQEMKFAIHCPPAIRHKVGTKINA
jgi:hypothetical protein